MQTQLLITLSEEKRTFFLKLLAELDFIGQVQEVLPGSVQMPEPPAVEPHKEGAEEENEVFGFKERVARIKKMKFVPPRDYSKFPPTPEELAARPGSIDVPPLTEEEKLTYEAEIEELLGEYPDEPPYTNYDNGIETGAKRENEQ